MRADSAMFSDLKLELRFGPIKWTSRAVCLTRQPTVQRPATTKPATPRLGSAPVRLGRSDA
jgi:hypothetical protein